LCKVEAIVVREEGNTMKRIAVWLSASALTGVCALPIPPVLAQGTPSTFRGQVWTWSEEQGTVTLLMGNSIVRVKVAPEELRRLQLHQTVTIKGELAEPTIGVQTQPLGPMTAVPTGPVARAELAGTVTAVSNGTLTVTSNRGPLVVWVAADAETRYQPGARVRVITSVQAVNMVPASADRPAPPAAPVGREPGDYAVVTGRILQVDPSGKLTIESPRGPIQVAVPQPQADRWKTTEPVQVQMSVHPAS
jgi:hypothetical protein